MPSLIDYGGRVDDVVDACVYLIETEGVAALTVRRIAAVLRLSPSSLASHLTNKHRMVDLVTKQVGVRIGRKMEFGVFRHGAIALVPDDKTRPLVRAWLALVELSRADEVIGGGVARIEDELRESLEAAYRRPRHDRDVETVGHLAVGLWAAMCASDGPMSAEHARELIARAESALGLSVPGVGQTTESGSS